MSFLMTNEHLDAQISQLKKEIRLSMNGVIVAAMEDRGLHYKKNFGVDSPRLRTIAARYPKNHDLAQRLWLLNIRETMILATLLQPVEQFTPTLAMEWLDRCSTIELVEQMNMHLYRHLPYALDIVHACLTSPKPYHPMFGYTLTLRIAPQLSLPEQDKIVAQALKDSTTDDLLLAQAIAACLARLCRNDAPWAMALFQTLQDYQQAPHKSQQLIHASVQHELIFLGLLSEDV